MAKKVEDPWRTQEDMRTLQQAEAIKADKNRMQSVKRATEQLIKVTSQKKPSGRSKSK